MTGFLCQYGYPDNYPNRAKLTEFLSVSKYAYEASRLSVKEPDKLKDVQIEQGKSNTSGTAVIEMEDMMKRWM